MEKNTVTLDLEIYEEMKRKIERLEKEVQQKTIVKYRLSRREDFIINSMVCILIILIIFGYHFL